MGTFHFMGVGKSVGAVTCAVDYIEKALNDSSASLELFSGTGGISHQEKESGKIEALVLFTSKEIIECSPAFPAYSYNGVSNPKPARLEIENVLRKVWTKFDKAQGRKIFWCEVNIDDYEDCFEKIVKVAYRFSPLKKQGKEIWCNLTSGSDSLGLALMAMSELTAKSTKRYLLSQKQDYRKFVQVPSVIKLAPNQDDYFKVLPFIKKAIDTFEFYEILSELEQCQNYVKPNELLNILRSSKGLFLKMDKNEFKKTYLLKMYSLGYTVFEDNGNDNSQQDKPVAITELGSTFLNCELQKLDSLINLERVLMTDPDYIIAESKTWQWFHEEIL